MNSIKIFIYFPRLSVAPARIFFGGGGGIEVRQGGGLVRGPPRKGSGERSFQEKQ